MSIKCTSCIFCGEHAIIAAAEINAVHGKDYSKLDSLVYNENFESRGHTQIATSYDVCLAVLAGTRGSRANVDRGSSHKIIHRQLKGLGKV